MKICVNQLFIDNKKSIFIDECLINTNKIINYESKIIKKHMKIVFSTIISFTVILNIFLFTTISLTGLI